MKLYAKILLILTFHVLLIGSVVSEGCSSTSNSTVQTAAYTSLNTIGTAVNAAEQGYMDLIVKGTISTNSLAGESALYNRFQADFAVAVALVSGSVTNAAPPALLSEGNAFIQSVTTLSTGK